MALTYFFAIAIQLAKLSGFSPIIATASLHNEAYLKSIGVTHVIDRHADPVAEVPKLVGTTPVEVVFSSAPDRSVWATALDVVAPGGTLILAAPPPPPPHLREKYSDRYIANVYANFQLPQYRALGESLYSKLTQLLEDGSLKVSHPFEFCREIILIMSLILQPNRVEVLPDGLLGIPDGLQRMQESKVSGVKLVAHPQETP